MQRKSFIALSGGVAVLASLLGAPVTRAEDKKVDFVKDVQPILAATCVKCHGADPKGKKPKGKLDLTTKEGTMKGGTSGADIKVGKAEDSLFYKTLLGPVGSGDDEIGRMPYKKDPLSKEQIETIKAWINSGAEWPDGVKVALKE